MSRGYYGYLFYLLSNHICFKNYVKNNLITNCDITIDDTNRADIVHGPSISNILGQTTRR